MPETHLRQPGFTYRAGGSCTKNKETIQKFKETGDSRYIYQNKLDKAYFQHDMIQGIFKKLIANQVKYGLIKVANFVMNQ